MPYYKDLNNEIHYLDSNAFLHLLPTGCEELTDDEVGNLYTQEDQTLGDVLGVDNELTPEEIELKVQEARRNAYILEADPLYFMTQRYEVQRQAWIDKIAEIKQRYPHGQLPID